MADDVDISALESDETYTHDLDTAVYQGRAQRAAANYRATVNPSDFEPAPDEPAPDPTPGADLDGVTALESTKVAFYDGIASTHKSKTETEVERFDSELEAYAAYARQHIDPNYTIPESAVEDLDVTDDGEESMYSNLVGDYDAASGGYSTISTTNAGTASSRSTAFDGKLDDAIDKLDELKSGQNSITNTYNGLRANLTSKFSSDRSGITNRNDMSVKEAMKSDFNTLGNKVDGMRAAVSARLVWPDPSDD